MAPEAGSIFTTMQHRAERNAMKDVKGLLVYDTRYGSTAESAYWIKALIGYDHTLEVKGLRQIITLEPYNYVIIGSYTRWEKPSKDVYAFIQQHYAELVKKQTAFYVHCGDCDETTVMTMPPWKKPHLSSGRNYFIHMLTMFPELKPVTLGGFGGRQTTPRLNRGDASLIWLLERTMPKDKCGWYGRDIWESMIPERVEAFANDIRVNMLGLPPVHDTEKRRVFWETMQPARLADGNMDKTPERIFTVCKNTPRMFYSRSRFHSTLDGAVALIKQWACEAGLELIEEQKTFYNVHFQARKQDDKKGLTIHIVPTTFPEDPCNVHIAFRCNGKAAIRTSAEENIARAEALLWADGRKVD